jgi:hypothetical protein
MNDFLKTRIYRVIRRYQWLRLSRQLTLCWMVAAVAAMGFVFLQARTGWASSWSIPLVVALAGVTSLALVIRSRRTRPDVNAAAKQIEAAYPELKGLLLTAVQQLELGEKEQSYFQYRVTQQATEHCQQTGTWRNTVPQGQMRWATAAQFAALGLFVFAVLNSRGYLPKRGSDGLPSFPIRGIAVTPGDATIEKGESLVVLARFGGNLPPGVDLVINDAKSPARKIPLVKSLGDPMFGGSVPAVESDFTYHVSYGGEKTREFNVKVFEHPRLTRADVDLKYPTYTKQPPKRIEDTRRVSAVEGTQLGLTLQLNKPVKTAKLVARNKEKTEIALKVVDDKAVASLADFPLVASQSYDLKLVDADGRTNKVSAPFVIDVLPNRRPELKLTSPRGDVRPSALEEITFEGTVFDDFGSPVFGLGYTVAGQETKFIELGKDVPAKEKRPFNHLVHLEELGVKPDDLVSWYLWADDVGPDGKIRRTSTDMYFAEVRPFEEIFREAQGQGEEQQQQGQGQGGQTRRLTELQKQIISATWKLQREPAGAKFAEDRTVVHDSQEQALSQAKSTQEQATNPRAQALWSAATTKMEEAVKELNSAKSPEMLKAALDAEQAAYQALLKLQARETEVARQRQRGQGQGGQQGNQRQIDELDLAQSENRYETQRQARAPQSQERREQNQILNRLQELARRQQDVNERLKELQTALQAAKTEQEKEEARRQLKRLQEEQQQMLADMDEVKQRMDRPENQSAMQQQREQLDQTREDVQRAADAAGQGSAAQALASGTRAQRQLQQMRDELRKQNSSEFAEDLKEMRTQARELAQQQEEVNKQLASMDDPKRKTLSNAPEKEAALNQLEQERKRMNELLNRATQISEQAEASEPLLSRQLYDSVRKVTQEDVKNVKDMRQELLEQGMLTRGLNDRLQQSAEKDEGGRSLDMTREMLREGYLPQAGQAAQKATAGINELKRGVEKAAESVIGDDAEALKLAQSELDRAMDQLERELKDAQAAAGGANGAQQAQAGKGPGDPQRGQLGNGQTPGQGQQPGAGDTPEDRQVQDAERQLADAIRRGQGPGRGDQATADEIRRLEQEVNRLKQANNGRQPGRRGDPQNGQNPGQTPGENPGTPGDRSQQQANNDSPPGNSPGQAGQPGQTPGGEQPGQGGQPGQAPGGNQGGQQRGNRGTAGNRAGGQQRLAGGNRGGGEQGGGSNSLENFIGGAAGGGAGVAPGDRVAGGPLMGENFAPWSDRLRDVEELLDQPALRDAVANARERARLLRQDFKRDLKKPDWATVQLQVLKPLVEVRSRITEELARRDSKDPLVPIDRDPVPNRYAESVRRYYEELGKDK